MKRFLVFATVVCGCAAPRAAVRSTPDLTTSEGRVSAAAEASQAVANARSSKSLLRSDVEWLTAWRDAVNADDAGRVDRLRLAIELEKDRARQDRLINFLEPSHVKLRVVDDVPALLDKAGDDAALLSLLAQWRYYTDQQLDHLSELVCSPQAAKLSHAVLRCGDLKLRAKDTAAALALWKSGYALATSRDEQCEAVDRVEYNSLVPENETAGFSAEVVSQCHARRRAAERELETRHAQQLAQQYGYQPPHHSTIVNYQPVQSPFPVHPGSYNPYTGQIQHSYDHQMVSQPPPPPPTLQH